MSTNQRVSDVAMDRREETVSTHQPGYSSTEQVTRDVAREHQLLFYRVMWIAWAVLGVLEALFGLRFFLKLIEANAQNGFAAMIYSFSDLFIAPFAGIVATPVSGNVVLEMSTVIAMAVYALFFVIVISVIGILADRGSSRTAIHTVHEQMPDGSDRTIRTTKSN